jgi:hypothetical protein
MNVLGNSRLGAGLLVVVFLSPAVLAAGGERDPGDAGQAPQAEPRFKAGDTLVIAAERSNLMLGKSVVTAMPKGYRIVVVEFRDPWVGTYATVDGQKKSGWIRVTDVVPTNGNSTNEPVRSAPPATTVGTTTERAAVVGNGRLLRTAPRPDPWDAYLTGYYLRHETDPNIHVWEPWRNR